MARSRDAIDPKGLIREAYRIEGIGLPECRSIFLDWAIGVPDGEEPKALITALLERYADEPSDHPMTQVLSEGLNAPERTGRRGGRRARQEAGKGEA
ncbi:hypothetical protein [Ovoidimarina sediminis]|uniref:hypothetical protein n=1 Tax=Ovoidimarina sediminis TaxID=3079856 RepID=UPI0029147E7C|nr:hypothetical protein [Rhodophyticola sp. MJ-SS7]MDU8945354.1 hypothetical protein [Rhodophyticola sp. MJ-SS7]